MSNIKEQVVRMPNDEFTGAKHGKTSLIDITIKMVCSEGFLLLLGLTAIAVDPLFFYIPMMKNNSTCLTLNKTLIIVVVMLRTLMDVLHDWSWWCKSHHGRVRYKSERLAMRKWISCNDRLHNFFEWFTSFRISSPIGRSSVPSRVIAIIASLPLPRVATLALDLQSGLLAWITLGVTFQFVPRYFRIHPTYVAVVKCSNIYAWIGAAFNLLLFVLAGHGLGGFWYVRAIERKMDCMEQACQGHRGCAATSLYCQSGDYANNGFISEICAPHQTSNSTTPFDYGVYSDAVKSNLIGSTNIINKLSHGLWWGLNNLSSMAQNLEFHDYIWDTLFAIFICILGLFLIALLIGNLQMYLQSKIPSTLEKSIQKRDELQRWIPFFNVPRPLRKEVNNCHHRQWLEVCEVNLESFLNNISWDLKKKLKPYFYNGLFNTVKRFKELDRDIQRELRDRARPVVFQPRTVIHEEGHVFYEMIYILQGKVLAYNNDDKHAHRLLKKDQSFGEELLQKALESSPPKLPKAEQTFESMTKVEAFVLSFDDLTAVFTKYGRTIEPYKKDWAANVITGSYKWYVSLKNWRESPKARVSP